MLTYYTGTTVLINNPHTILNFSWEVSIAITNNLVNCLSDYIPYIHPCMCGISANQHTDITYVYVIRTYIARM